MILPFYFAFTPRLPPTGFGVLAGLLRAVYTCETGHIFARYKLAIFWLLLEEGAPHSGAIYIIKKGAAKNHSSLFKIDQFN
ncbi:MAG: hypothetical protein JKY99_02875 [Rhizobiales bacterium]|nr:hypothetical protein [Hyphomicrobiales bacterium]